MEFTGNIVIAVLDSQGNSMVYSSSKEINDLESANWRAGVPTIALRRIYTDGADKIDTFRFNLDLPGVDPEDIRNIQVLTSFEYLLT